jgi:hypothetical protein
VHRPSQDTPFGVSIADVESAGYVRVWDVRTREMSLVNRNLLRSQLGKKDDRGRTVFTTVDPKILPARGALKCPLHPQSPERKDMDRFGFVACTKANLKTRIDVRTHMQHRHHREYEALEEDRRNQIESEERQVRQTIIGRNAQPAREQLAETETPSAEPAAPAPESTMPPVGQKRIHRLKAK